MQPPGRSRLRKSAPWLFRGAIAVAVLALIVSTQLSASRRNAKIAAPGAVIVAPITGFGGYNWYGTYNDSSQSWLGVGENFTITMELPPFVTISCQPRWILNANGNVTSSSYGC